MLGLRKRERKVCDPRMIFFQQARLPVLKLSRGCTKIRAKRRISYPRKTVAAGLILCLSGCMTTTPAINSAKAIPQATAAFFSENPKALLAAAREACKGPGEKFVRSRTGSTQCHMHLDPTTTAAVILGYDGDINALPKLVVSLSTMKLRDGYLVTGCAFLKVPRKNGQVGRIVQNDRGVDAKLRELLTVVGGTPVRDVPKTAVDRCLAI